MSTLLDLISNSLVLAQLAPYIPLASRFALIATCRSFSEILLEAPETFRYTDLSGIRAARLGVDAPIDVGGVSWRAERMDENLTEDEFYCGPLRGVFRSLQQLRVLKNIRILILDTLSVPVDLVQEIASDDRFNVRILSIRDVTHFNERKCMQLLRYLSRPSRPEGTPRLKALYLFGPHGTYHSLPSSIVPFPAPNRSPSALSGGIMSSEGAQIGAEWNSRSQEALDDALDASEDRCYQKAGVVFKRPIKHEWGSTLAACGNVIAFDAVVCRGPRHDLDRLARQTDETPYNERWVEAKVATVALGSAGCVCCGSSREGAGILGESPQSHLPLLSPPPLHSASVRYAQMPATRQGATYPPLFMRCDDCLRGRYCERCYKFWDEACYDPSTQASEMVDRQCFGCGRVCATCRTEFMRRCCRCQQEFCVVDNEGWSLDRGGTLCDWCSHTGRRTRELY